MRLPKKWPKSALFSFPEIWLFGIWPKKPNSFPCHQYEFRKKRKNSDFTGFCHIMVVKSGKSDPKKTGFYEGAGSQRFFGPKFPEISEKVQKCRFFATFWFSHKSSYFRYFCSFFAKNHCFFLFFSDFLLIFINFLSFSEKMTKILIFE